MQNQPQPQLVDVVTSFYLRKWKVVRVLGYGCAGLVGLVLLIVVGAMLEGGSGVAVPLAFVVGLGVPAFLFARYAHRRVTDIDSHDLVAALRENAGDVDIVDRSWTVVPDLTVAGLLSGRKQRLPCLKFRVGRSGKRYVIPMSEEQCDAFAEWLGSEQPAGSDGATQRAA